MGVSLLMLVACVLGSDAYTTTPGEVMVLDADNFAAAIKEHAFIAVEFYAPVRSIIYFLFQEILLYFFGTFF